jgi:hypothetical protein
MLSSVKLTHLSLQTNCRLTPTKSLSQHSPELAKPGGKESTLFKNATGPLSFDPEGRKELSFFHIVRINHKYGVSVIKHTKQIIIKMSSTNAIININANCDTFDEDEVTSKYTPLKKSAWESFKGFWMTHHNLRRHPFAAPGHPKRTTGEKSF